MAEGYALARPPVHPRIMQLVRDHLAAPQFRIGLDIGSGAGLSTRALTVLAARQIGIEPAEAMLQWRARIAPSADFLVAAAEHLPFRSGSIDLIVAAGSLNYVNLEQFFPEAARVLEPGGLLLPYDFAAGRNFAHQPGLDVWFTAFRERYPFPQSEAIPLNPTILDSIHPAFAVTSSSEFSVSLPMTFPAYIDYMLTETNVAAAVRRGVDLAEIKAWCEQTLRPVWQGSGTHDILFPGYFACMRHR